MDFNLATTVSFGSAAVTLAVATLTARLGRGEGTEHFRYALGAALAGTVFCVTDACLAGDVSLAWVVWVGRLNLLAVLLHAASWLRFLAAWDERPLSRVERMAIAASFVAGVVVLIPGATIAHGATDRVVAWAGVTYRDPQIGPLALPVLAIAYATQVLASRAALRVSARIPSARVVAAALVLLCAVGLIDILSAVGLTTLPYFVDPVLALVCLSIGTIVAKEAAESAVKSAALERTRSTLAERENLAALGQLAAVVAHEVRNPVAIIFGALSSLKRAARSDEDAMLLGIVGDEAERLKQLVARLLEAVRPFELQYSRKPVAGLVAAAISQVTASANVAASEVELVDEARREIECDEVLLEQAISNIVQNALLARGRRAPVRVGARVEAIAPEMLCIEVIDDGEGVPDDAQARLFTPFFTTRATGTGLGLALVRRIASAHGGSVEHEAPAEGGARFILRVPLRAQRSAPEASRAREL